MDQKQSSEIEVSPSKIRSGRWQSLLFPKGAKAWLRAVFLFAWTWSVTSFILSVPSWVGYITIGCLVALAALTIGAFFISWRLGLGFVIAILVGLVLFIITPIY